MIYFQHFNFCDFTLCTLWMLPALDVRGRCRVNSLCTPLGFFLGRLTGELCLAIYRALVAIE